MKKFILALVLLSSMIFIGCSSTAVISDISNPTIQKHIKVRNNIVVNQNYVFVLTKKGTPQVIHRDRYRFQIISNSNNRLNKKFIYVNNLLEQEKNKVLMEDTKNVIVATSVNN